MDFADCANMEEILEKGTVFRNYKEKGILGYVYIHIHKRTFKILQVFMMARNQNSR